MRKLFLSCLCDQTCPMATQDKAAVSPHPGAICHPPVSKAVRSQYELKADECVPRHTTVFAPTFFAPPLFVRQLHIPCSKDFPRQDSAQPGEGSCLQHSNNTQLLLHLSTLEPVWGAGHFPLSSSLLFCHKTESRQSLSPPVPKKLKSTDAR